MNKILKGLVILGMAVVVGGFLGGCYTQLENYSATEESYAASKKDQGTSQNQNQNSGQSYSEQQEAPAETDTVYIDDNQQQTENNNQQSYNQEPGTTNIYNYYSPVYPYGPPYWPNGWYGDWYYDYPYGYPYYDGFYFSVTFGSPYYYDPFLWDWRYSTPFYRWSMAPWYNPYRYYYWEDWGGVDWWWYSTYTYEQRRLKHRPFNRREGLDRRRQGGLIEGPVVGSGIGGGVSTGFSKPTHRPDKRRNGLEPNPVRIRKQNPEGSQHPADAIRVEKIKHSGETEVTRIRKAKRYHSQGNRILIRNRKRTPKTTVQEKNRTRKIYIRRSKAHQTSRSTVNRSRTVRKPAHESRIRVIRRSNSSHRSTQMRVHKPPVRHSSPVIQHRSHSSSRPSYSPPAPRSRATAPARRSSSSSRSRSKRGRK